MTTHSVQSINRDVVLMQLRTLMPELIERYAVSKIGIFGSVARNEATDDSDIDIVVCMEPNIFKRFQLREELKASFGREVDVIRYRDAMNPYLKARIDQDAVYV